MSCLEYFEKNYEVFSKFDGKIGSYKFPRDINEIFAILMEKVNDKYLDNCKDFEKDPSEIYDYRVLLDKSGNCYLEVIGADQRTKVVIIKDSIKSIEDYNNVTGKKIMESFFGDILNLYQTEKVKKAGISSRFLKDSIPPIDLVEEFECEKVKKYYEYLGKVSNETKNISMQFEAPINIGSPKSPASKPSKDRVNDIIDYDIRKQILSKYKPLYIINLTSTNGNDKLDGYVYVKDGYYMVVCEPISGKSYTLYLNIGPNEYITEEMLLNNIKAALEAKEEVVLMDDAIMRKSHTTLDAFTSNVETFLNERKENKRFLHDIEESKEVYGNVK